MTTTPQQIKASLLAIKMLADSIRELKEVPSGHLYAMVMGVMNLETYTSFIDRLKEAKLVSEKHHLLAWTGPNHLEFVDSDATKETASA